MHGTCSDEKKSLHQAEIRLTQRANCVGFVLTQINKRTVDFTPEEDTGHQGEKWLLLVKDGQVCQVFPDRGQVQHSGSTIKLSMLKVMFLVVWANSWTEYGLDGRNSLYNVTQERF